MSSIRPLNPNTALGKFYTATLSLADFNRASGIHTSFYTHSEETISDQLFAHPEHDAFYEYFITPARGSITRGRIF